MKKYLLGALLPLLAACTPSPHDKPLVLHYDRPAEFFEEALPIGNGRMGAMVYGDVREDRLTLNDITLWTGEPDRSPDNPDLEGFDYTGCLEAVREALEAEDYPRAERLQRQLQGHYSESYQPLGTLRIRYRDSVEVTDYRRELDLRRAVATVTCKRDGKAFRAEYFASAPDSVIVLHLISEAPLYADIVFDTPQPHTTTGEVTDGYVAYHAYPGYYDSQGKQFSYDPDRGIHFRTRVSTASLEGCTEATILLVNATSFNGFDKDPVREGLPYRDLADARMARVQTRPYKDLLMRHTADYQQYFDRLSIDLGTTADSVKALPTDVQLKRYADLGEENPELEALYCQYGRYLLIASSRTPGVPANLQGLWNESMDPPWSGNYTININLEENYWIAESGALPEMHEVLLDFLHNVSQNGVWAARTLYEAPRGWCAGHNSDIWAMAQPVGLRTGSPCWANWNMGGVWLSTHIWEHFRYGGDVDRLRKDWPVLKGAAEFCLDYLVEKDGELITSPGTSPENLYRTPDGFVGATLYGATADLALIRECLTDAVGAAEVVGSEEAFIREAADALGRLRGYHIGADGSLQEWYHDWADWEPQHRHQTHLVGLYPGHQVHPGDSLAAACAKALEIKGFETTGWSCGWRINLYARLGDTANAYKMLRRLLRYVSPDGYRGPDARRGGGTYPNLLDAHSPFQIDGNFGGAAGILEILTSCPDSPWPDARVEGIRKPLNL